MGYSDSTAYWVNIFLEITLGQSPAENQHSKQSDQSKAVCEDGKDLRIVSTLDRSLQPYRICDYYSPDKSKLDSPKSSLHLDFLEKYNPLKTAEVKNNLDNSNLDNIPAIVPPPIF
jgi:hypothetical protein